MKREVSMMGVIVERVVGCTARARHFVERMMESNQQNERIRLLVFI
jgi:hypothetical protein